MSVIVTCNICLLIVTINIDIAASHATMKTENEIIIWSDRIF